MKVTAEHDVLRGVVVIIEVVVSELDAVVIDRNRNAGAGIVIPNAGYIEIDPRNATALPGVLQMPLITEQIVGWNIVGPPCKRI